MPGYDLLVYRDFSTQEPLVEGDAGQQLASEFEGMNVVAVGPPIHSTKEATAVVLHRREATPEIRSLIYRGGQRDQIVDPRVEVLPASAHVGQPPNAVILRVTGAGVSERVERERAYVVSPDEADDIARKLAATADMVRTGRGEFSSGDGGS